LYNSPLFPIACVAWGRASRKADVESIRNRQAKRKAYTKNFARTPTQTASAQGLLRTRELTAHTRTYSAPARATHPHD